MKTWNDEEELLEMFVLFGRTRDRGSLADLIGDVRIEAIKEAKK